MFGHLHLKGYCTSTQGSEKGEFMVQQLAYAIITPYTIRKSRTGAVLARLLGRASSELIAARMMAPDRTVADSYADSIAATNDPAADKLRNIIRDYIRESLGPAPDGRLRRAMMLVFKGDDARREIADITGSLTISCDTGDTIRNSYGDLVWNQDGSVRYFEPALLISDPSQHSHEEFDLWMNFLEDHPALLEGVCTYEEPEKVEQTLVLIKPDCWRQRSGRPGNILDMFSRTGLRIIGCKLCHMSVEQAVEFYGPVKTALEEKLAPKIGEKAKESLEHEFGIILPDNAIDSLGQIAGVPFANDQFEQIVEFMSGSRPSACSEKAYKEPGSAPALALVYEGEQGVSKIHDVLGPTDPTKAPSGTVRREFGSDVMVNTAHASDSPENAQREIDVLGMRESNFKINIKEALKECNNGG